MTLIACELFMAAMATREGSPVPMLALPSHERRGLPTPGPMEILLLAAETYLSRLPQDDRLRLLEWATQCGQERQRQEALRNERQAEWRDLAARLRGERTLPSCQICNCKVCNGTGRDPGSDNVNWLPCSACGGKG